MPNYSNALIGFDSQVELAKNISASTWISEEDISEFNASIEINNIAWLFRIDGGRFFNYAEYSAGSLFGLGDAGHLTDTYAAADCSDKDNITAGKHTL